MGEDGALQKQVRAKASFPLFKLGTFELFLKSFYVFLFTLIFIVIPTSRWIKCTGFINYLLQRRNIFV